MTAQSPAGSDGGVIFEWMTERTTPREERLQIGRLIVERIRNETNSEFAYFGGGEGEDVFRPLYLTERDGCIPNHLVGDDLLLDIRAMYSQVFDGVREELKSQLSIEQFLWLAVDPSYEDSTFCVLCSDEQVLVLHWSKAWNFYWPDEEAMASSLGRIYEEAAKVLAPPPERQDGLGV